MKEIIIVLIIVSGLVLSVPKIHNSFRIQQKADKLDIHLQFDLELQKMSNKSMKKAAKVLRKLLAAIFML